MQDLFEKIKPKTNSVCTFEVYIDGACSGNPGPAGIGVIIYRKNCVISNFSKFIGIATNNIAEYTALLFALEQLLSLKATKIIINTDSQLLANQLKRKFKVKNQTLKNLHQKALKYFSLFEEIKINNIPRDKNHEADKLAVKAVKEQVRMAARHKPLAGGKSGLQRET